MSVATQCIWSNLYCRS